MAVAFAYHKRSKDECILYLYISILTQYICKINIPLTLIIGGIHRRHGGYGFVQVLHQTNRLGWYAEVPNISHITYNRLDSKTCPSAVFLGTQNSCYGFCLWPFGK